MTDYSISPDILVTELSPKSLEKVDLGKSIIILVSKTVRRNFKLDLIFDEFGSDKDLYIFDHVKPDAHFEDIDFVINSLNDIKPEGIIAIGGGSVIDAGKALSISFEGVPYGDIFYGKSEVPDTKIRLLAVPTTAGTGAELSYGAIILDEKTGIKGGLRGKILQPDAVIIDSRLHNACPFKLKAEVGFDCFTHAIETYISLKSNPITRMQSVNCINTIFDFLIPACRNNDSVAMEKIAISSTLMGINLALSSTCMPHRIQYVIGPLSKTSHAQGLIALYKGWLDYSLALNLESWKNLMCDLKLSKNEFIHKVESLKKELQIDYSLTDLGIMEKDVEFIASEVTGTLEMDPAYSNTGSIINILKKSL